MATQNLMAALVTMLEALKLSGLTRKEAVEAVDRVFLEKRSRYPGSPEEIPESGINLRNPSGAGISLEADGSDALEFELSIEADSDEYELSLEEEGQDSEFELSLTGPEGKEASLDWGSATEHEVELSAPEDTGDSSIYVLTDEEVRQAEDLVRKTREALGEDEGDSDIRLAEDEGLIDVTEPLPSFKMEDDEAVKEVPMALLHCCICGGNSPHDAPRCVSCGAEWPAIGDDVDADLELVLPEAEKPAVKWVSIELGDWVCDFCNHVNKGEYITCDGCGLKKQ